MNWFERLTGFPEENPEQVRANLSVDGEFIESAVNGKRYQIGTLTTPSLSELRDRTDGIAFDQRGLITSTAAGEAMDLHANPQNSGSTFQVASQFNLLEMISPEVTPDEGVSIYEQDPTQGPACAIACGAATIYRNYFVNVGGKQGQSATHQIDCLSGITSYFESHGLSPWHMRNGYALLDQAGLIGANELLVALPDRDREDLKGLLRVGCLKSAQVTVDEKSHRVNQVFCSALPVAYSAVSRELAAPLSALVLEAAYEATIRIAKLNSISGGSNRLYLTYIGGGVFGNDIQWIEKAIALAIKRVNDPMLEVIIVYKK